MTELFAEPEKDGFKHESPIRAFTDYTMHGSYFIGKGFRPSMQHLADYLAAMEAKEGYRLVQILQADTRAPTMIFHRKDPYASTVAYILPQQGELREKIKTGLLQVTAEMQEAAANADVHGDRYCAAVDTVEGWVDRINGHAEELHPTKRRVARAKELGEPYGFGPCTVDPVEAAKRRIGSDEGGGTDERVLWNRVFEKEDFDDLIGRFQVLAASGADHKADCRTFLESEKAEDLQHYINTASVASVNRLKAWLDKRDAVAGVNHALEARMNERRIVPEHKCDDPDCHVANIPGHGHDGGEDTEDRIVATVRAHKEAVKAALTDDPINPKHYAGRECADIGERLSANGYQILKYCWRLGKKDDPCQELGKALWYLDSEIALIGAGRQRVIDLPSPDFMEDRIQDQPQFTQNIARMLWLGYAEGMNQKKLRAIFEAIEEHKFILECGRGLAI